MTLDHLDDEYMIKFEFDEKLKKCVLCDSSHLEINLIDFRGISISKCSECGFQFMNPQYTDGYLNEYYSRYMDSENFGCWPKDILYGYNFYFSLIEKYLNPGKLLDIGCGNGHLMKAAIDRGWTVRGYDVDQKSTLQIAENLNVDVGCGDFFDCNLGDSYDLVTLHQVLEHLKYPNQYMKKIYSLINNDGYIFVAVPNIKSLSNRFKYFLEKKGLRNRNIGKYYDTSHHVMYFEPETLVNLLDRHGFKVVYQRNCHGAKLDQSAIIRYVNRNMADFLFAKSTFLVIAKKI